MFFLPKSRPPGPTPVPLPEQSCGSQPGPRSSPRLPAHPRCRAAVGPWEALAGYLLVPVTSGEPLVPELQSQGSNLNLTTNLLSGPGFRFLICPLQLAGHCDPVLTANIHVALVCARLGTELQHGSPLLTSRGPWLS